jgi:hypothetical protein
MKKGLCALAATLIVAFLFVSFSTVMADPSGPIACLSDIVWDEHDPVGEPGVFYWWGPLYGCELEGFVRYDPDPNHVPTFPGNSYHWYEVFTIYPNSGGEIHGNSAGTVQFSNSEFRANGWVTDASPEWADLIGYKYHEKGTVLQTPPPQLYAPGTLMRLSPANNTP